MSVPLQAVKNLVKERYLGKCGIHAVGMRRSENAIRVYVSSPSDEERERLLKEIEAAVAPFKLLVVTEEPPSIK